MFEFDKYEPNRQGVRTHPTEPYQPFKGGKKRAFLLWGEHCIECAAPDCYASCDLYDARPDERCRRLEYGIYKNTTYPSAQGFGAEVVFKRWGKLEARGNATMLNSTFCTAMERIILTGLPMLNLLGKCLRLMGADIRWSYLTFGALERFNRWLMKWRAPQYKPDAFLAEIYNPSATPVNLVLSIGVDSTQLIHRPTADQMPTPFIRTLVVEPGYNHFNYPMEDFSTIIESSLPFNITMTPNAEGGQHLVFLTLDFIIYHQDTEIVNRHNTLNREFTDQRPVAKCVVFDLDNTLWDGILLEGDVTLKPGIKELFTTLDQRGILISISSKNSYEDAISQLENFGLEHFLLFPQINWAQKSKNIKIIAEKIDINLDTFIFVDDNSFERDEVGKEYPQVEIFSETILGSLLDNPRLQGSKTDEALQRRAMYQAAITRDTEAMAYSDDYLTFLKSCEIVVDLMPVRDQDFDRLIELVQRTNQLNFSGRKYSRENLIEILNDHIHGKHVISCSDKYGSYGIVGFALSVPIKNGVRVEDFMLSCRVQGKFIEQALFDYLIRHNNPPAKVIEIHYVRTDRNGLAEAVLKKLNFNVCDESGSNIFRLNVEPDDLSVDFMTIRDQVQQQPQIP